MSRKKMHFMNLYILDLKQKKGNSIILLEQVIQA